jgi:hypothetical protein
LIFKDDHELASFRKTPAAAMARAGCGCGRPQDPEKAIISPE